MFSIIFPWYSMQKLVTFFQSMTFLGPQGVTCWISQIENRVNPVKET